MNGHEVVDIQFPDGVSKFTKYEKLLDCLSRTVSTFHVPDASLVITFPNNRHLKLSPEIDDRRNMPPLQVTSYPRISKALKNSALQHLLLSLHNLQLVPSPSIPATTRSASSSLPMPLPLIDWLPASAIIPTAPSGSLWSRGAKV